MSSSQKYKFKSALIADESGESEWADNVTISIADGVISAIETDSLHDHSTANGGVAIPAMVNVHSHAFQRGFAGLSEYRTADDDSFWTWRELMYDFVGRLSVDDVFVIAHQVYLEMLLAGYSWVGEFHYLHNSGSPYDNPMEMSEAVLRAANETGIGVCLLPVLYQRSGFDTNSTNDRQRRFVLDNDEFFRLLESCKSKTDASTNAALGLAFHSLRAVSRDSINETLEFRRSAIPDCPVHIHVAEQVREVADCVVAYDKKSVEYLLSEFEVNENWCLIHATHMDDREIEDLINTRATVGLCPTTEANLGDGFFAAEQFLNSGGTIAIGSDSHCSVDVREELRMLEYGQRLKNQKRAVLGTNAESVGRRIHLACASGGGQAIGVATGRIAVGYRADLLTIDDQHRAISGARHDRLLDRFVFTNSGNPISGRMVGGRWIDENRLNSMLVESTREFTGLNQRLLG